MVDSVDAQVEALATSLTAEVPVAVIDARSAAALERVGGLAGTLVRRSSPQDPQRRVRRGAARGRGTESALAAMPRPWVTSSVRRWRCWPRDLGSPSRPWIGPPGEIHAELAPQGVIDVDETLAVTRALVFAGADDVPAGLAQGLLADVHRMVASQRLGESHVAAAK